MSLQSESIDQIVPALIAAKRNFAPAVKDAKNPHFNSRYVSLDGVTEAITTALLDAGIFHTQPTDIVDGATVLHTRFLHVSGQWIGSSYPVHAVKKDPQGEGSALTYARRYALMALAGIAPEDDDGNAAVAASKRESEAEDVVVSEWSDAIAGAADLAGLDALGKDLAVAKLPASGKSKLRAAFGARRAVLAKAEAVK